MNKENIEKEEFIRVGTTLYKLVNQPRLNGGHVKKRIVWNNETHHERRCRTLDDYRYVRGNSMGAGTTLLRKM